jgi:rare lipoprotein A
LKETEGVKDFRTTTGAGARHPTRRKNSTGRTKMISRFPTIAALGALLAVTGCQPRAAEEPTQLTQAQIDSLKAIYPSLREEPAPEPQPNGTADPSQIPASVRQALSPEVLERVTGEATFYADSFEGRRTASGVPFHQNQMVAAHRAYPFGTVLRVTNTRNDRSVKVRVVDRGPFGGTAAKRNTILDLSRRAANELGFVQAGRTPIQVEVLEWGPGLRS